MCGDAKYNRGAVDMQLCGARGGGDAAPRSMYWVAHRNLTFMLVLDSERERNAAIMLARRFAYDCNVWTLRSYYPS